MKKVHGLTTILTLWKLCLILITFTLNHCGTTAEGSSSVSDHILQVGVKFLFTHQLKCTPDVAKSVQNCVSVVTEAAVALEKQGNDDGTCKAMGSIWNCVENGLEGCGIDQDDRVEAMMIYNDIAPISNCSSIHIDSIKGHSQSGNVSTGAAVTISPLESSSLLLVLLVTTVHNLLHFPFY